jgi:hypothetical protein
VSFVAADFIDEDWGKYSCAIAITSILINTVIQDAVI